MENTVIFLGALIGFLFLLVLFFVSKSIKISKKLELSEKNLKEAEVNIRVLEQAKKINENLKEKQEEALKDQLKIIGSEILEKNSKKYSDSASEKIEALLKPFKENIEKFRKEVESEGKERFSLGEKVHELKSLNLKLSEDAQNLTQALKGDSKMMGDWGEHILKRVLENSGLECGREYSLQHQLDNPSRKTDKKMRPDAVIFYPDERILIIDSKVSIKDFTDSFREDITKEQHNQYIKAHVASIKKHIDELHDKAYDQIPNTPDFVIMFVPNENALNAALEFDSNLWEYAYKKRVILMNPLYLLISLKIVFDLWKSDRLSKDADKIAKQGALVYEKLANFSESMLKIGSNLQDAWSNYDKATKQLSGHDGLISRVIELKGMGVQAKKEIKNLDAIGPLDGKVKATPELLLKAEEKLKAIKD